MKRVFGWWLRGMLRKDFHSVRILAGSKQCLANVGASADPAIVVGNHSAWWDPLVGLYLHGRFMPRHAALAPMDAAQLRRFFFFRRLGIFGIEPNSAESLQAMTGYVRGEFDRAPKTTLWITPQGEFADVRTPIRIRPGASVLAAQCSDRPLSVISLAIEYVYWTDRRPELMLAVRPVPAPGLEGQAESGSESNESGSNGRVGRTEKGGRRGSTTDWTRAIRGTR